MDFNCTKLNQLDLLNTESGGVFQIVKTLGLSIIICMWVCQEDAEMCSLSGANTPCNIYARHNVLLFSCS